MTFDGNNAQDLLQHMYGRINDVIDVENLDSCMLPAVNFYADRNVLTTTNSQVTFLNREAMKMLNGEAKTYYSADKCADGENAAEWSPDFLNTQTPNGLPAHELQIKVGCPLMCLRNLSPQDGLCNGTRLIVTNMSNRIIQGRIIGNKHHAADNVLIPRITLKSERQDAPFTLYRHQFPVRVAFSMTINKSQGQTMKNVAVYLENRIFSHGQCYVMLSRVGSMKDIKILALYNHGRIKQRRTTYTLVDNVVYYSVFAGNHERRPVAEPDNLPIENG